MESKNIALETYNLLRNKGLIHTQQDFANLLKISKGTMSKALQGDRKFLTENLEAKIKELLQSGDAGIPIEWASEFPALDSPQERTPEMLPLATLPLIPIEAMAGTLGEFAASVASYDCERIISPIKGADYAMKVCGESMSPEYPNGSQILIKKVNENAFIEWGKVYVLDTANGAVIKQIRKTDKENVVECVSLNPDYQPFTIDTSFINGWYRVLMVLSLK